MTNKRPVAVHLGYNHVNQRQCLMVLFSNGVFYPFAMRGVGEFSSYYRVSVFTTSPNYEVLQQISNKGLIGE